jgi:hypothetical protein
MAAVTVTNRRENVSGSRRMVMANIAGTTTSDTWATGLKTIVGYSVDGGAVAVTSISVSGGTLTIGTASALGSGTSAIAWGY